MTRRILFVGEHETLCKQFAAQQPAKGDTWTTEAVRTGAEALAKTGGGEIDAVIADVELPDGNGLTLLDEIMRQRPKVLRIIRSEIEEQENTMACVGRAHHHVLGSCTGEVLARLLHQAVTMESWLPSEPAQSLISEMRHLPSTPSLYFQVASEIQSPNATIESVAELVSRDPAVTAKLLQLANSAMFGLEMKVSSPAEAIGYIGLETTHALVLLAHTFSSFEHCRVEGFSMESLWQHSVRTGQFAQRIAMAEGTSLESVTQAFIAGLLHDVGKLLFAANLPGAFVAALELARDKHLALWQAEAELFGVNHAELGGCMLGIWGLPAPIVDAVAYHHFPLRLLTQSFSPLTATFAANIFEHADRQDAPSADGFEIDAGYLKRLGLGLRVEDWQRSCLAGDR